MKSQKLYAYLKNRCDSPQAPWIMAAVSFLESWISPFPPDPMLALLILARRSQTWRLTALCGISSVVGGIVGYFIGLLAYNTLGLWLIKIYHLETSMTTLEASFQKWGFWIIVFKAFTPIPFKLVTILSGILHLDFMTFLWASTLARFGRFYLFSAFVWYYNRQIDELLQRHMGSLIILGCLMMVVAIGALRWFN
jgi:membrane protein YqaA with SNARE-associated domain